MLPKVVHKLLESLFTYFQWKRDQTKKGGAKVAYHVLCRPKGEGGLGLKCPVEWNMTQIMSYLYRLVSRRKSLLVSWVHENVLMYHNFWTLSIPTDCSLEKAIAPL